MPQSNQSGSGLIGINNMSIVCNVDNSCKRLLGSANNYITANGISLGYSNGVLNLPAFSSTRLLFNFQTLTSFSNILKSVQNASYHTQIILDTLLHLQMLMY